MIRLNTTIALNYEADEVSNFILNIQPVNNEHQRVSRERLIVAPLVQTRELTLLNLPDVGNRVIRFSAGPGPISVTYQCVVDIAHRFDSPSDLNELPAANLPDEALPYILPSRYCESDRLMSFALSQFGALAPGYARVAAIAQWVEKNVRFRCGSSQWSTSAWDIFQQREGVCRDFAHLMIALCRALNVPSRFVTGIDYGADPALGPLDFHAYVEAYLGGRWYIFDPSGISPVTGLLRIGTGRDAADVSFATIFGNVRTTAPRLWTVAVDDPANGLELPQRSELAVSTCAPARTASVREWRLPRVESSVKSAAPGLRLITGEPAL
jgi:transglutaminase-like putative cysteine protease